MTCGIYRLRNICNNKLYFGQSTNIEKRTKKYFYGEFPNNHLENAFNKYGKDNFESEIMFECPEEMLDVCEELLIYLLDTQNREKGYNKDSGGNLNKHRSEETKRKISEAKKGKSLSDETKQKISEAKKGANNFRWKNYARIIKAGKNNGKQQYIIKYNGKKIKYSIDIHKLIDWWNENYPTEPLHVGVNK